MSSDDEDAYPESITAQRNVWRELWTDDEDLDEVGPRLIRKTRQRETENRVGRYEERARDGSASRFRLDSSTSPWWELINHRDVWNEASKMGARFRRKFRLPMCIVMRIITRAQKVKEWKDKPGGAGHGRGPARHPLILKVLAALRSMAKGVDAEELEDGARISESTLKVFIPEFIHWLATAIYEEEVRLPEGAAPHPPHLNFTINSLSIQSPLQVQISTTFWPSLRHWASLARTAAPTACMLPGMPALPHGTRCSAGRSTIQLLPGMCPWHIQS